MGSHSGFCGGFSGKPYGQGHSHGARGSKADDKEWIPVTKLDHLVKDKKIQLEGIHFFSLPIKVLEICPSRVNYWGITIRKPHTFPCKLTSCCGSVLVCLIPVPQYTGIVSASVPKKLLLMAVISDYYTLAKDCTATLGNFAKTTFDAISKTYSYLTSDI
ncbi:40S ribosomal protein S2 [Galemys pyrenaicus]|uniref:Small ribosomal subunit protein uS5 n=1 Tax=Galemys pyrenaicus TaxID=202257 RepID=A0A8J6DMM8_GALPY|nr:40S ribosomal protein S2 [Galemys pyrenaicus]